MLIRLDSDRLEQRGARRDELPSAATVGIRLGLWSEIAATLVEQNRATALEERLEVSA